jgi:hypothetical protein
MASLDDTCLLHRGGLPALEAAKHGARTVIDEGGSSTPPGMEALLRLDRELLGLNASPGGSADLLAAALLLDSIAQPRPNELHSSGTPLHPNELRSSGAPRKRALNAPFGIYGDRELWKS